MPQYMITLRNADGSDGVGPPRYLTFNDTGRAEQPMDEGEWVTRIIAGFPETPNPGGNPARNGDILFLVHGFNVSHDSAKTFHMQCVKGLATAGWTGQLISFDWPSDGLVFAYLPDRNNARAAASALVTSGISLLEGAQKVDCTINVHALAHSMGCFVVQQAFTWAYQDVPPDWQIGQLLLAAADVDWTVFSEGTQSATAFDRHAGRLTAYCDRYDKALAASSAKRLELEPRMGRVGLPDDAPQMMCEVDCSDLFEAVDPGVLNKLDPVATHCFYFKQPEFWQDVVLTLAGGIDRSRFPTRNPDPAKLIPNRFVLKVPGPDDGTYKAALRMATTTPSIRT
jgi:esterase/lipase superfamily enzyme